MRHPYTEILMKAPSYAPPVLQPNEARGLNRFQIEKRTKIATVCAVLRAASECEELPEAQRQAFRVMWSRVEPYKKAWVRAFGYGWEKGETLHYSEMGPGPLVDAIRGPGSIGVPRDTVSYDWRPEFRGAVEKIKEMEAVSEMAQKHGGLYVQDTQRERQRSRGRGD